MIGLTITYSKGSQVGIDKWCFYVPKIVINIANCVDSDELSHPATFYLNLHCLLKYSAVPL